MRPTVAWPSIRVADLHQIDDESERRAWRDAVVLAPFTTALIRIKASQLCRRADFSFSDGDELQQEMRRYLLRKVHLFDASRGASLGTFVAHAIDSWVRMLLRERQCEKRRPGIDAVSLDNESSTDDAKSTSSPNSMSAKLTDADRDRRLGRGSEDYKAAHDRADAMAYVMRHLSDDQRELVAMVIRYSKAGAAKRRGVSRRQIDKALAAMRPLFERAGFGFD